MLNMFKNIVTEQQLQTLYFLVRLKRRNISTNPGPKAFKIELLCWQYYISSQLPYLGGSEKTEKRKDNESYFKRFYIFPGSSDGKEYSCNVGDPDSISGLGRSPGERGQQPTQVFFPGEFRVQRSLGFMGLQRVRLSN